MKTSQLKLSDGKKGRLIFHIITRIQGWQGGRLASHQCIYSPTVNVIQIVRAGDRDLSPRAYKSSLK